MPSCRAPEGATQDAEPDGAIAGSVAPACHRPRRGADLQGQQGRQGRNAAHRRPAPAPARGQRHARGQLCAQGRAPALRRPRGRQRRGAGPGDGRGWAHEAADAGNLRSEYMLGCAEERGDGVPQDFPPARSQLRNLHECHPGTTATGIARSRPAFCTGWRRAARSARGRRTSPRQRHPNALQMTSRPDAFKSRTGGPSPARPCGATRAANEARGAGRQSGRRLPGGVACVAVPGHQPTRVASTLPGGELDPQAGRRRPTTWKSHCTKKSP